MDGALLRVVFLQSEGQRSKVKVTGWRSESNALCATNREPAEART